MVGQVMWELIEPLDDESIYALGNEDGARQPRTAR
jgi:hypothetical protein